MWSFSIFFCWTVPFEENFRIPAELCTLQQPVWMPLSSSCRLWLSHSACTISSATFSLSLFPPVTLWLCLPFALPVCRSLSQSWCFSFPLQQYCQPVTVEMPVCHFYFSPSLFLLIPTCFSGWLPVFSLCFWVCVLLFWSWVFLSVLAYCIWARVYFNIQKSIFMSTNEVFCVGHFLHKFLVDQCFA